MRQEAASRSKTDLSNISFQQKSTAVTLVITGSVACYYFASMWGMRQTALADSAIPDGFGGLVLTTVGLIVLAQIVLQLVLVFGAGSAPAQTAVERAASHKAARNAYWVLLVGSFAAVGSAVVVGVTQFDTINLVILGFVIAEMVKYGSQIYYGRRG